MQFAAGPLGARGLDAFLLGAVVAELLHLRAAARAELLHDRLLLGRRGVEQLQDLLAHLRRWAGRGQTRPHVVGGGAPTSKLHPAP